MATPTGPQVTVEGGRQLRKTLKAGGVALKDLSAVNRKAAHYVAGVAKARTPYEFGGLKRTVRGGATSKAAVVRAGNNGAVAYANPIHWGWPRRDIAAQPWIAEAAADTEPQWFGIYADDIEQLLRRVKGA